ncbi:MAG: alkaline phosphatase, partial [Planctomycetes bacterium]|nr:alkaline phosphatase [Planctomycetota bacterium]
MPRPLLASALLPVALLTAALALFTFRPAPERSEAANATPRNVILFICDGMGPQQVGLLFDWATAAHREPTALEGFFQDGTLGVIRTGAADSPLTDSAASATAMACGVATNNGMIAQTPDGHPLPTALEDALANGRRAGLVTTARVTHATPACFAAHIDNRDKEEEIAKQLVDCKAEVILGGGARYFTSERQNLTQPLAAAGWTLARSLEELRATRSDQRVLGLFHPSHLLYAIDRDAPDEPQGPTLAELTGEALRLLDTGEQGYFLMVEAGRIDHAGHANDVAALLGELREFDEALKLVLEYQRTHPDTLVVLTADHETGGLCMTYGINGTLQDADFLAMTEVACSTEVGIETGAVRLGPTDPEPLGVGRQLFHSPAYRAANYAGLERSSQWKASFGSGNHSTTPVYILARGPGGEIFAGLHHNT